MPRERIVDGAVAVGFLELQEANVIGVGVDSKLLLSDAKVSLVQFLAPFGLQTEVDLGDNHLTLSYKWLGSPSQARRLGGVVPSRRMIL